jgi:hypothetical protein
MYPGGYPGMIPGMQNINLLNFVGAYPPYGVYTAPPYAMGKSQNTNHLTFLAPQIISKPPMPAQPVVPVPQPPPITITLPQPNRYPLIEDRKVTVVVNKIKEHVDNDLLTRLFEVRTFINIILTNNRLADH